MLRARSTAHGRSRWAPNSSSFCVGCASGALMTLVFTSVLFMAYAPEGLRGHHAHARASFGSTSSALPGVASNPTPLAPPLVAGRTGSVRRSPAIQSKGASGSTSQVSKNAPSTSDLVDAAMKRPGGGRPAASVVKRAEGPCFERDTDYYGNDVEGGHDAETPEECQEQCVKTDKCNYFTFEVDRNMCWLKNTKLGRRPGKQLVSGPRNCSARMELRDLYEHYESPAAAADAVLGAFKHAWGSYSQYCFGQDELRPLSRGCINEFGMGLTLVDSLDTLYILGLDEEFEKAKLWVSKNLRVKPHKQVSVFETIIRVLGGLLSAHGLSQDKIFLDKALALANSLSPALTGNIPKSKINLATGQIGQHGWAPNAAIIAEVGSLQVEMWYLTQASREQHWNDYGEHVIQYLDGRKPPIHGLYPTFINPHSGSYMQSHISFGALGDSLYEYLLKMWILKGKKDDMYRRMYLESIQAMMDKLLVKSNEGLWYIAEMRGNGLDHKMDHLTCFAPGMLALGAHHKVSKDDEVNKKHLKVAEDVAETCVQMYMRWPISPEMVRFTPYMTMGTATNFQRPETVESLFVLWQVTKDPKWRKYGWVIFQKFERHLRVEHGYASLNHVGDPGSKADKMESFLLAESYKYLYLLFKENPSVNIDSYVFNTEAHPMPVNAGQ